MTMFLRSLRLGRLFFLTALPAFTSAMSQTPAPSASASSSASDMAHVVWCCQANIFQINVRQFSADGTLNAVAKDLPKLEKMDVDSIEHKVDIKIRLPDCGHR
jgi:hypothetical protein